MRTRPVGGAELLSSRHFPEEMQGNLIVLNTIGFRGLLNYKLTEDGAGLKSTEVEPILQSADENFRPVDAEVGPDGALYIADWHNPIIGHMQHNLRDTSRDQEHGRIYRVTYPGRPLLTAGQDRRRADSAAARSAEGAGGSRPLPRQDRAERPRHEGRAGRAADVDGQARSQGPGYEHHMMEALWVHQWHNRVNETLLTRMLRSSEPWARAAATRVLCYWRDRVANPLALLKVQANDEHPGGAARGGHARRASSRRRRRRRSRWSRSTIRRIGSSNTRSTRR